MAARGLVQRLRLPPRLKHSVAPGSRSLSSVHSLPPGRVRAVVTYPHDALNSKLSPVADPGAPDVLSAVADLLSTVATQEAMGLAAPQLGLSQRVFVVRKPLAWNDVEARALLRKRATSQQLKPSSGGHEPASRCAAPEFVACIDPRIVERKPSVEVGIEACLSFPDCAMLVRRYSDITVNYVDGVSGQPVRARLSGLPAVVFQHELDHLDGVLLPDREVRAFFRRSQEEEWEAAQERWLLGLTKYYGMQRSDPHMQMEGLQ